MIRALNEKYRIVLTAKNALAAVFCRLFLLSFPNKWSVLVADRLGRLFYRTRVGDKSIALLATNDLLLYRAKTFHSKEVETNAWIAGAPANAVFYDVGANVGVFSLLAAQYFRKVFAFEPVSLNYSILNQNLMANGLGGKVTAYCVAISERAGIDTMRLSSGVVGSAHHTFGANLDANHAEFNPVFEQGCFAVSLDELVYERGFECPTYLKIDVDGNEQLVIAGARRLLRDPRLQSVLIELNQDLAADRSVEEAICASGFTLKQAGDVALFHGMRLRNLIFFRA